MGLLIRVFFATAVRATCERALAHAQKISVPLRWKNRLDAVLKSSTRVVVPVR